MKIALYLRTSTDRQDCENQRRQLQAFGRKQGWEIVHEYMDQESGAKSNRSAFQLMFADASKRKFELVLFWSLDRLSREGVLPTLHYLERLTACGVGWKSFTEPYFDSCGVFKDAVIAIMATLARQERIRISERTKAGLALARARGQVLGRPKCDADPAVIRQLRRRGFSFRKIGAELGISPATALMRLRLKKGHRAQ